MAAKKLKKFKEKPHYVYAIKYDGKNSDDVISALSGVGIKSSYSEKTHKLRVAYEPDGVRFLKPGQYIILDADYRVFFENADSFESRFVV